MNLLHHSAVSLTAKGSIIFCSLIPSQKALLVYVPDMGVVPGMVSCHLLPAVKMSL